MSDGQFITLQDAARRLPGRNGQRSASNLAYHVTRGNLRAQKIGGTWYTTIAWLDAWIRGATKRSRKPIVSRHARAMKRLKEMGV
jgi:hypothetical protein